MSQQRERHCRPEGERSTTRKEKEGRTAALQKAEGNSSTPKGRGKQHHTRGGISTIPKKIGTAEAAPPKGKNATTAPPKKSKEGNDHFCFTLLYAALKTITQQTSKTQLTQTLYPLPSKLCPLPAVPSTPHEFEINWDAHMECPDASFAPDPSSSPLLSLAPDPSTSSPPSYSPTSSLQHGVINSQSSWLFLPSILSTTCGASCKCSQLVAIPVVCATG